MMMMSYIIKVTCVQVDPGGGGLLWYRMCQDWQCWGLRPGHKLSLMDQLQRGGKIRDMMMLSHYE